MDPGWVKGQNICVHGRVLCFNLINMKCQKRKNGPYDPTLGVKVVWKGSIFASILVCASFSLI